MEDRGFYNIDKMVVFPAAIDELMAIKDHLDVQYEEMIQKLEEERKETYDRLEDVIEVLLKVYKNI